MKRFLLSSAVVLALTAAAGASYKAVADTISSMPGMAQPSGPPGAPGQWGKQGGPGAGAWNGPGRWSQSRGPGGPGFGKKGNSKFSMFAPAKNKNLSDADVKVIATAILLEHGNHDWGVSNVVTEPDKSIQFSFATHHGDVIATFAVDPASGHIKRVG